MKRFLIILSTIGIINCSSTVYVRPDISIPDFRSVRPERPVIEEGGTALTALLTVGTYAKKLEAYADGLENYLDDIEVILNDTEK